MRNIKKSNLLFLLVLWSVTGFAQRYVNNEYHINLENGLSSNNVYNTHVDYLGYLWICTDNGVFRYNGYSLKRYGFADGLPNSDIWNITEDAKHRLLLHSTTNTLGYLQYNKYHRFITPGPRDRFYPRMVVGDGNGFLLLNGERTFQSLYIEHNDTFRLRYRFNRNTILDKDRIISITPDKKIIRYILDKNNIIKNDSVSDNLPDVAHRNLFYHNDHIFCWERNASIMDIEDLRTGKTKKIGFTAAHTPKEAIYLAFLKAEKPYVLTNKRIYFFDTTFRITASFPLSSIVNNPDNIKGPISVINSDSLWSERIATSNAGLIINYGKEQHFQKIPISGLQGCKYLGIVNEFSYWWDQNNKDLMSIDSSGHVYRKTYHFLFDAVKLVAFSNDRALLLTKSDFYWLMLKNQTVLSRPLINRDDKSQPYEPYFRDVWVADTNHLYIGGYYFLKSALRNDTLYHTTMSPGGRFYNIAYDSLHNSCWIYNNDELSHYSFQTQKHTFIDRAVADRYGIQNFSKIICDPSGIYLKDNDNLYKISIQPLKVQRLFRHINLEHALLHISDHKIILAGKFGLLFSTTANPEAAPVIYHNIRNILYHQAEALAVFGENLILKTDRAVYRITIPSGKLPGQEAITQAACKVIYQYRDTLHDAARDTAIRIINGETKIGIDIINPYGNGALKMKYLISGTDSIWHAVNGSDIILPALLPENNYTLYIHAGDDVWSNNTTKLSLYIVPLWWQKQNWQLVFWIAGGMVTLGILLIVMWLTRNYVIRAGKKKQYMTMLELRSIYAQLNPHFIFNTLNTALYFIKKKQMEQAATHVTTFSRLLRAYLESSRNRYITIEDEITNLNNYIRLEQQRFEDTFSFTIVNKITTPETFYIPSLLLQPIVENAINHGLLPKGKDGHLQIEFICNPDKSIVCIIDDNGIGRLQAMAGQQIRSPARTSHGSRLIHELTEIFNKYEKTGIEITYIDKVLPLSGTRVLILIKTPNDKRSL